MTTATSTKILVPPWLIPSRSVRQTVGIFSTYHDRCLRCTIFAKGRFRTLPPRIFVQAPEGNSRENVLIRSFLKFASSVEFTRDSVTFTPRQYGDYPHSLLEALITCVVYLDWDITEYIGVRCLVNLDEIALHCIPLNAWYVDTRERVTFYLSERDLKAV